MSNYEASIAEIVLDADLSNEEIIDRLGEFFDGIEEDAYQSGYNARDNEDEDERDDTLNRVRGEFVEIIDSFTKHDLQDVRMRLIDLGCKTFNLNIWIPKVGR